MSCKKHKRRRSGATSSERAAAGQQKILCDCALKFGIGITFVFKHRWSLRFKEFYVGYQPWISLIYAAIFAGPIVGYWLC